MNKSVLALEARLLQLLGLSWIQSLTDFRSTNQPTTSVTKWWSVATIKASL